MAFGMTDGAVEKKNKIPRSIESWDFILLKIVYRFFFFAAFFLATFFLAIFFASPPFLKRFFVRLEIIIRYFFIGVNGFLFLSRIEGEANY